LVCYQSGLCFGTLLKEFSVENRVECKNECRKDQTCAWFTFDEMNQKCKLNIDCTELNFDVCPSCFSGQEQCGNEGGEYS